MNDLTWTTEKPQAPGRYWWRAAGFYVGDRIVQIIQSSPEHKRVGITYDLYVSGDEAFLKGIPLSDIPGQWAGPIPLPTEAPAQALVKAGKP